MFEGYRGCKCGCFKICKNAFYIRVFPRHVMFHNAVYQRAFDIVG